MHRTLSFSLTLSCVLVATGCDTWQDPPLPGPRLDERNAILDEARTTLPRVKHADESEAIAYLDSKNAWIRRAAADRLAELAEAAKKPTSPAEHDTADTDMQGSDEAPAATAPIVEDTPPSKSPAVEALIAALDDDDWRVRVKASSALGAFADPRAIDPLIDTLIDPDRKVRMWAWKALRQMGPAAWKRMYERFAPEYVKKELSFTDESGIKRNLQEIMRADLVFLGKQGVSVAAQMLRHEVPEVSRTAAQVLTEIGAEAKDATVALVEATQNEDIETRLSAIRALAKIGDGDPIVRPTLETLVKDKNKRVLDEAKKALSEMNSAAKKKDNNAKKDNKKPLTGLKPQ